MHQEPIENVTTRPIRSYILVRTYLYLKYSQKYRKTIAKIPLLTSNYLHSNCRLLEERHTEAT